MYNIKLLRATGITGNFVGSCGSHGYNINIWLNPAFLQNYYQVKVSTPAALGRIETPPTVLPHPLCGATATCTRRRTLSFCCVRCLTKLIPQGRAVRHLNTTSVFRGRWLKKSRKILFLMVCQSIKTAKRRLSLKQHLGTLGLMHASKL